MICPPLYTHKHTNILKLPSSKIYRERNDKAVNKHKGKIVLIASSRLNSFITFI